MQLEAPARSPGFGRQTCYERAGASPAQVVEAAGALDQLGFATDEMKEIDRYAVEDGVNL